MYNTERTMVSEEEWEKIVNASVFYHQYNVKMGETNNVDPDDGNSWVCNACLLPIFSTPFVAIAGDSDGDDPNVMHIQCASELPQKIEGHPSHPGDLSLSVDDAGKKYYNYCDRCLSECGSRVYACKCGFKLDLVCALSIKIAHRSHPHRLTATRGRSCSFICNACGIQHQPPLGLQRINRSVWDLSYACSICDFWIHPDCALLPSAIAADKYHPHHPLLLNYVYRYTSRRIGGFPFHNSECDICKAKIRDNDDSVGWYECFHCDYSVHVKCVSDSDPPYILKQVLLREAKIPGLLRLPMPNEHENLVALIMKTYTTDGASTSTTSHVDSKVHKHPLIFHNNGDDIARICNACVRLISPSDSFYSCHERSCIDFCLHDCCAHLPSHPPSTIFNRRLLTRPGSRSLLTPAITGSLSLLPTPITDDHFNMFIPRPDSYRLRHTRKCNGFAYSPTNKSGVYLDVVSALMPAIITHDAHSKSHILLQFTNEKYLRSYKDCETCSFCSMNIYPSYEPAYECNNRCDFFLHGKCAILPDTVSHDFDPHPLKLTIGNRQPPDEDEADEVPFCEICERDMDTNKGCYYGCSACKQAFHIDCFPYFDKLSKVKFGFTVRVMCHDCPLACVRARPLVGYRCEDCKNAVTESDEIAFECGECYFRMHEKCAWKLLKKSQIDYDCD